MSQSELTDGPFGETLPGWSPLLAWDSDVVNYGYTGRQFDSESGEYYYRARMYNPATGRFMTTDPLGLEGGDYNLYRYVLNNPKSFYDPTGQSGLGTVAAGVGVTLVGVGLTISGATIFAGGGTAIYLVVTGTEIATSTALLGGGVGVVALGAGYYIGSGGVEYIGKGGAITAAGINQCVQSTTPADPLSGSSSTTP